MNITLFLHTGKTFTFKNIDLIINNETHLTFKYIAMSDGKEKVMNVAKSNIVGFSTYVD